MKVKEGIQELQGNEGSEEKRRKKPGNKKTSARGEKVRFGRTKLTHTQMNTHILYFFRVNTNLLPFKKKKKRKVRTVYGSCRLIGVTSQKVFLHHGFIPTRSCMVSATPTYNSLHGKLTKITALTSFKSTSLEMRRKKDVIMCHITPISRPSVLTKGSVNRLSAYISTEHFCFPHSPLQGS